VVGVTFGLVVITGGLFTLLAVLPYNSLGANSKLYTAVHRNDDLIIWSLLITILLLNAVGLALTLKYAEKRRRAGLLVIPVAFSLAFLVLIVPTGFESTFNTGGVISSVADRIEGLVGWITPGIFFATGFGLMVVSLLISTYCLVRLLARNRREWLLIPLSLLFLPVGLWWLQPRWRALTDRKPVEEAADHFVE